MRKLYTILTALLLTATMWAQIPQKMSYQAIIRGVGDVLIANQGIGMRLTILDGMVPVFVETHSTTTDANAVATVEVGAGTPVTGTLAGVNWGSGIFTIKTETDPTLLGGTTYTITGTSDVLSVPYALHVKVAADATFSGNYNDLTNKPLMDGTETKVTAGSRITVTGTGATATPYTVSATPLVGGFTHYLGEDVGDGIIFYIYTGSDGLERVLIANYNESAQVLQDPVSATNGTRTWDGVYNTPLYSNSAARTYVEALGHGWYIPAIDELGYMYQNRFHLNKGLFDHGAGATQLTANAKYWSSTENSANVSLAWDFNFETGHSENAYSKSNPGGMLVRAVRALIFIPALTTDTPSSITSTSATCGGNISSDGGATVTVRGVCWNTTGTPSTSDTKTSDGTGTGSFTSSMTGLTLGTIYYVRAYATNSEGTSYGDQKSFKAIALGDTYLGGKVFYIDATHTTGLIGALVDQSGGIRWSITHTLIAGMGTAIGTGFSNTQNIIINQGAGVYASKSVFSPVFINGYNDWYLPSRDELLQLWDNRALFTGFAAGFYWSSSQNNTTTAIYVDFNNRNVGTNLKNSTNYNVRAIKSF